METINPSHFFNSDIRVGTIISASPFPEARKPAYKLLIDFGELGELKSSAQITELYKTEALVGKQILAVVNLPEKQIGPFISQCLVLGLTTASGVVLIKPDSAVKNGLRLS